MADLARRALIRLGDPAIKTRIASFELSMNLSHQLPQYWARHPRYSRNIGTLAGITTNAGLPACMIDVGANIGDTAAVVLSIEPTMQIMCIDADEGYLRHLRTNARDLDHIEIVGPIILAEVDGQISGSIERRRGTARLVSTGESVACVTLDALLRDYPHFAEPAILKSDTDGFEARVLGGADLLLEQAQPVLHLEYDPRLLAAAGSDGLQLLEALHGRGYTAVAIYDNLGLYITDTTLGCHLLDDLHRHASCHPSLYYDLVLVPKSKEFVVDELRRFEVSIAP